MRRFIEDELLKWKESSDRKPLVLRGMRQTGKTYTLTEFGRRHFDDVAYFNFEGNDRLAKVFEPDLDVNRIIRELSIIRGNTITMETLIIFDEIQFCYPALTSLKYFSENAREYYVACAGSLLGLKLSKSRGKDDSKYSFPAGKVDFLKMRPMCFGEFVLARRGELVLGAISEPEPYEILSEPVMSMMEELFLEYLCVGGMPEAVSKWVSTEDMSAVVKVQRALLESYENDMAKYCSEDFARVSRVWSSVATQAAEDGDRFRLKDAGGSSKDLSGSIDWLLGAEMVRRAWEVNNDTVPLNPRGGVHYKLYMGDVGLFTAKAGIQWSAVHDRSERTSKMRGALAETFVLLELDRALDIDNDFHYWKNEKGKSEVDFVVTVDGRNVPVEVKFDDFGRLPSLEVYCDRYSPDLAMVVSRRNVRSPEGGRWMFLPLYLVWRFAEYAGRALRPPDHNGSR